MHYHLSSTRATCYSCIQPDTSTTTTTTTTTPTTSSITTPPSRSALARPAAGQRSPPLQSLLRGHVDASFSPKPASYELASPAPCCRCCTLPDAWPTRHHSSLHCCELSLSSSLPLHPAVIGCSHVLRCINARLRRLCLAPVSGKPCRHDTSLQPAAPAVLAERRCCKDGSAVTGC